MFDFKREELYDDLKPLIGDAQPTWGNLFSHFNSESMSTMAMAKDFEEAKQVLEVHQMCMGMAIGIAKMINTSVETGDKAAAEVALVMNADRQKYDRWTASADPEFRYLPEVMAEHGYAPSGDLLVALAFLDKWGPHLRDAIPRVITIKPELETHFVSALLTIGVGEIISPYKILMWEGVEPHEVDQALEIIMDFIETQTHPWHLANVVTGGLLTRFVTMLSDHPGLTLYTGYRSAADDSVIEAVVTADVELPLEKDSASKHRQVINTRPGQTKFEAVRENIEAIIRDADVSNYKLTAIRIMDDDGRLLGIEEFFQLNGQEVPQSIREELDRHG